MYFSEFLEAIASLVVTFTLTPSLTHSLTRSHFLEILLYSKINVGFQHKQVQIQYPENQTRLSTKLCQAQPQPNLSWGQKLALILVYRATLRTPIIHL